MWSEELRDTSAEPGGFPGSFLQRSVRAEIPTWPRFGLSGCNYSGKFFFFFSLSSYSLHWLCSFGDLQELLGMKAWKTIGWGSPCFIDAVRASSFGNFGEEMKPSPPSALRGTFTCHGKLAKLFTLMS